MRVLLVEDNQRLNRALALSLREEGYAVDCAFDGIEGQEFAEAAPYDAIILDVLLPRKDGFDVCRDLRRQKVTMPILLLTARDSVADRVRGLDSGADDYLVKPFALQELLARMRALLRRGGPQSGTVLCVADLSADPATHHVERAGRRLALTAREFSLLEYFLRRPNHIVTRSQIEEHLWSYDVITASNVVDAAVRRLRRKIDDPFEVKLLETLYGLGYRLRDSGDVP
jgi:two-component system, OmpR family, copper resistance phosphate regulon response regulator CusR